MEHRITLQPMEQARAAARGQEKTSTGTLAASFDDATFGQFRMPHMGFNLARIDLVSLRLASLCAQTGSLSAASRRAHCSISAASERLAALEDALGARLFIRDHRGLKITAAGELLVHHATFILESLEVLHGQLSAPRLQLAP
ncbi:hypothetical protein C7T35_39880 [Variovorax sp. WS11]|uniref:helix-turn-helix domain-containing protein n=1 Tax=Variovorax sp. WS11 TaxID=1105204 RepID=UPI000D0E32E1|nr:LysR family transcriptional regulator [Variovorax sp. WS11]NDZ18838.1 LysR family transcriptional regulator [Variovorax sp. WS11]PSL79009.1 hypothetical protein C7T35_39880 [Variovorax sp. WS11]